MDLKTIAQHLKELGEAELKKLAAILEADVETDIGLTKGGNKVTAGDNPPPTCPQGYVWSVSQGKCILDVG